MSNQERRLMRRMERQGGNAQTRGGLYLPQGAWTPQDEQDRRRDVLAERLLEIGLENAQINYFTDGHKREPVVDEAGDQKYVEDVPVLTVEEWFVKLAEAALKAAEVIYPELPDARVARSAGVHYPAAYNETREHVTDGSPCWCGPLPTADEVYGILTRDLPAAAQEGFESVVDVHLNNPQRTLREGAWEMSAEEYARRLSAGEVGSRLVVIDHSGGHVDAHRMAELLAATPRESALDAAGDVHPDERPVVRGEG